MASAPARSEGYDSSNDMPVPILIQKEADYRHPNGYLYQYNPLSGVMSTNVEIIRLPLADSMRELFVSVARACIATLGQEEWNGQRAGGLGLSIKQILVHWQGDAGGRARYTFVHEGNVRAVMERLNERGSCDDVVIVLVE